VMPSSFRHPTFRLKPQSGVTLIELLVALALGLVVTVIAATALLLGQQGYQSVDATTSLRDRERFAIDLISRLVVQAGFQDFGAPQLSLRSSAALLPGSDPEPDIFGWNDAVYATPNDLQISQSTTILNGGRPSACGSVADTSCRNGSDILVIRYQGINSPITPGASDNTMINCAGQAESGLVNGNLNDRSTSIFHVTRASSGEPSLSCTYYSRSSASSTWVNTPILEGVESFQVLYGTDGVTANVAPAAAAIQDTVPDRWLRADQLTVAGNVVSTRENWRRVRAIRIGLVMRGPAGSAQQAVATTLQPLGSLYLSPSDTGSVLNIAADGRIRKQSAFTVHLRNDLTLR